MKVKVESNFGRFAYTASASIPDGLPSVVVNTIKRGIGDTCFRAVGSDVEKALVKHGGTHEGYVKGKVSVPSGNVDADTPRGAIPYTAERASVIESAAKAKLDALAKGDDAIVAIDFVVTGEHVFGENAASPMKRATALVDTFIGTPMEAAYRTVLGVAADVDRDGLIAAAHAKGLGIQPPKA